MRELFFELFWGTGNEPRAAAGENTLFVSGVQGSHPAPQSHIDI